MVSENLLWTTNCILPMLEIAKPVVAEIRIQIYVLNL